MMSEQNKATEVSDTITCICGEAFTPRRWRDGTPVGRDCKTCRALCSTMHRAPRKAQREAARTALEAKGHVIKPLTPAAAKELSAQLDDLLFGKK